MDDDFERNYDFSCPKCGHSPTHSRECNNFCEDGWIDMADEDPINHMPGEDEYICQTCCGTGIEQWCPKCGFDITHCYVEELKRQLKTEKPEQLPDGDPPQTLTTQGSSLPII